VSVDSYGRSVQLPNFNELPKNPQIHYIFRNSESQYLDLCLRLRLASNVNLQSSAANAAVVIPLVLSVCLSACASALFVF